MTARSSAALSVPPTQNTAPVHEFRCLYTHDVRKKQKKWQDGRVKYHTFNKRVMLYDDTLNFVGDTHWKEGGDLQPGDEVKLDEGVLIELDELLVTTQTDLAPLFDKTKQQAKPTTPGPNVQNRSSIVTGSVQRPLQEGNKQKHRSLNALLSGNRGTYGKASLPIQSPYEARKANQENEWGSDRSAKRRKTDNVESPVSRYNSMRPPQVQVTSKQATASSRQVVDITSDDEMPMSEITQPSSPRLAGTAARTAPKIPKPKVVKPAPRIPRAKSPRRPQIRPSSPPISTKSKIRHVDAILSDDAPAAPLALEETPTVAKTKTLRLAKSTQRPMLFSLKKAPPKVEEPAKPIKKPRVDLFSLLSESEEEVVPAKKVSPGKERQTQIKPKQAEVTIPNDAPTSETAAFETGQSSSPQRTIIRRRQAAMPPSKSGPHNVIVDLESEDRPVDPLSEKIVGKTVFSKSAVEKPKTAAKKPVLSRSATARKTAEDAPSKRKSSSKDSPAKKKSPVNKASATRQTAGKGKKSLRNIIDASNEAAEDNEDVGTRAMEEQARALERGGPQREQGAWTIEATDLFDWRPPDWEQRTQRASLA